MIIILCRKSGCGKDAIKQELLTDKSCKVQIKAVKQ